MTRTKPAKGTLSDLFVRAMAIEDGDSHRVVIVSVDLIAVSKSVATAVANEVNDRVETTCQNIGIAIPIPLRIDKPAKGHY